MGLIDFLFNTDPHSVSEERDRGRELLAELTQKKLRPHQASWCVQLIKRGVDPNLVEESTGRTALTLAAEKGHANIALALLEKGADINAQDRDGWTALAHAAKEGQTKMLQTLIEKGANIDAQDNWGWTALYWAIFHGQSDAALTLIEKGADVNTRNTGGVSLIDYAMKRDIPEIIIAIINSDIDVNMQCRDGKTLLMNTASLSKSIDTTLALIEKGADIHARNEKGETAIICAARTSHTDAILALIKSGADVNAQDNDGKTALMYAADNGHTPTILALVDNGADPALTDNEDKTAEHMSKRHRLSYDFAKTTQSRYTAYIKKTFRNAAKEGTRHTRKIRRPKKNAAP
ncbi:MAG: ankyrin repeat domain-containing protein [Alphaproteobacteria bacterium]|nr:ankyrin repeat domain-containing protein [Alphaproteobacteria bacterium]